MTEREEFEAWYATHAFARQAQRDALEAAANEYAKIARSRNTSTGEVCFYWDAIRSLINP